MRYTLLDNFCWLNTVETYAEAADGTLWPLTTTNVATDHITVSYLSPDMPCITPYKLDKYYKTDLIPLGYCSFQIKNNIYLIKKNWTETTLHLLPLLP